MSNMLKKKVYGVGKEASRYLIKKPPVTETNTIQGIAPGLKKIHLLYKNFADAVNRELTDRDITIEFHYVVRVNTKDYCHHEARLMYNQFFTFEIDGKDGIIITDFKTGSVRKKGDIEKADSEGRMGSYLRQLAMYSYLIKQSPKYKVDVRESRLEFLEAKNDKESIYDTVIRMEQINSLIADIKDYDNLIRTGKWVERPCGYNSYGKNTKCEYCKMAEIYKI